MFLLSERLQGWCDFRLLIEARKLIWPGAITVQVSTYIGHQVRQTVSFVVACYLVVRVAQGPLPTTILSTTWQPS